MMHPEEDLQIAVFQWAELQQRRYPDLKWMYHAPNGGYRTRAEAARFKLAGVKSGVPDIFLPVPRGVYHGLYIELKVGNNKPTKNQIEWLEGLAANGYHTCVCYDLESVVATLRKYLALAIPHGWQVWSTDEPEGQKTDK